MAQCWLISKVRCLDLEEGACREMTNIKYLSVKFVDNTPVVSGFPDLSMASTNVGTPLHRLVGTGTPWYRYNDEL